MYTWTWYLDLRAVNVYDLPTGLYRRSKRVNYACLVLGCPGFLNVSHHVWPSPLKAHWPESEVSRYDSRDVSPSTPGGIIISSLGSYIF